MPKLDRYTLDINETTVCVIKTHASGQVVRAATADAPPIPEVIDKAYQADLTRAIKQAARAAKLPIAFRMPCAVVMGGPHIVVRRFSWPDMPPDALRMNAQSEIAPYLPENTVGYSIGYEVLRQSAGEATPLADVLVAAVQSDLAAAVGKAVGKAGFIPTRLDVRENARGKLVRHCEIPEGADSCALLDVSRPQINMSLYLNGVFYSNRYFAEVADTDTLANEVSSIIDYLHYRERDARVGCVLLLGEDNLPEIAQSLADYLDVPVYKTRDWVKPELIRPALREKTVACLDAFGAALPALSKYRLNLTPAKADGPSKQLPVPLGITAAVLAVLIGLGIVIPQRQEQNLRTREAELTRRLASYTVTVADIARLNGEIRHMSAQIDEINAFFGELPPARMVLPTILRDSGFTPWNISSAGDTVTIAGDVSDFNALSNSLVSLRGREWVSIVHAGSAADADVHLADRETTRFSMTVTLEKGTGVR